MNIYRHHITNTCLATCAALSAAALLIPLGGTAQADVTSPPESSTVSSAPIAIDDLVAQRKAAWAAHREAYNLF